MDRERLLDVRYAPGEVPAEAQAARVEAWLPEDVQDLPRILEESMGAVEEGDWHAFQPFRTTLLWLATWNLTLDLLEDPEQGLTLTDARQQAAEYLGTSYGGVMDRVVRFQQIGRRERSAVCIRSGPH